jgi:hypothetical protein
VENTERPQPHVSASNLNVRRWRMIPDMTLISFLHSGLRKCVYALEMYEETDALVTSLVRMHFAGAAMVFAGSLS